MQQKPNSTLGFGDANAKFRVYISAPPPMPAYQQLTGITPLQAGDIHQIYLECGNGWRKIFNVYAKLLLALPVAHFDFQHQAASWQQFRDSVLLQKDSNTALCFAAPKLAVGSDIKPDLGLALGSDFGPDLRCDLGPDLGLALDTQCLHLIAGRTLAKQLIGQGLPAELCWLTPEFAIDPHRKILVTPFFDYRQLNNEKIGLSAKLLQLLAKEVTDVACYCYYAAVIKS